MGLITFDRCDKYKWDWKLCYQNMCFLNGTCRIITFRDTHPAHICIYTTEGKEQRTI